ncbi:MAG: 50S ribosomal protein L28 [Rickettsiaceae bacterium]
MSRKCSLSNKSCLYGNNVSHSNRKTRRAFKVNIMTYGLFSEITKTCYRLKIAASTIRDVEKAGGFDQYLIKAPDNILSKKARVIKSRILKKYNDDLSVKKVS